MKLFGYEFVKAQDYADLIKGKKFLQISIQGHLKTINELHLQYDVVKDSNKIAIHEITELKKELDAQLEYTKKLEEDIKASKVTITTIPKAKGKKSTKRKAKK